jgi:hypothetical protein
MLLLRALERQLRRRGARLYIVGIVLRSFFFGWPRHNHRRSFTSYPAHPVMPFGQGAPVGPGRKQPDWSVESVLSYMAEHDISTQHDATERSRGDT